MEWNQVKLNLIEIIPRFSDYSTTAVKIVAAVDSELDGSSQPFLVKKKKKIQTRRQTPFAFIFVVVWRK